MIEVKQITHKEKWDQYVFSHPSALCYQLFAWGKAVEKAYGHRCYYLVALSSNKTLDKSNNFRICGVLPLVHLRHAFWGNSLVSLPFCDYGGIISDSKEAEDALFEAAMNIGQELGVKQIELRCIGELNQSKYSNKISITLSHKVRMLLDLPGDSEKLWRSFKSKLRSQIKKPEKEGLTYCLGGAELLNDFYNVFGLNMRDIGSPVHSKRWFIEIMTYYRDIAKIGIVYKGKIPVSAGIILYFKDTVTIPWSSSLRKFNSLSPNMLLYWNALKFACENGYKIFDFGRSTPGEGTYKFKEQWGAKPVQLYWHYWLRNGGYLPELNPKNPKYQMAIKIWKKLPVSVANYLGPYIRKYIPL